MKIFSALEEHFALLKSKKPYLALNFAVYYVYHYSEIRYDLYLKKIVCLTQTVNTKSTTRIERLHVFIHKNGLGPDTLVIRVIIFQCLCAFGSCVI